MELPRDEIIFAEVLKYGYWERSEVQFLGRALQDIAKREPTSKPIFLDIGANTGLVSRQLLVKAKADVRAILIEPIGRHVEAINFNLSEVSKKFQIDVHQFALGTESGSAEIFTEGRNQANSSLIRGVVPIAESRQSEIEVVATSEFSERHLNGVQKIILKSDTQGFDARILSRLPSDVWDRVEAAVIEVWAIPEIDEEDVAQCLKKWRDFTCVSWSATKNDRLQLEEIFEFWLSKNSASANLFLRK